jgi:O-antigen/teichoic acid export membrane protein
MIINRLFKDSLICGDGDIIRKLLALANFPAIASVLNPGTFGRLEIVNRRP